MPEHNSDTPHVPADIDHFMEMLSCGADGWAVAAHRGVRINRLPEEDDEPGTAIGYERMLINPHWERAPLWWRAVDDCVRRLWATPAPPWLGWNRWSPAEVMVRLVTFTGIPLGEDGRARAGRANEVDQVLGLALDLDVANRRPGDDRPYCPTIEAGLAAWREWWTPTLVIDAGGGLVGLWLFTEPTRDTDAATALGHDLHEEIARSCAERGWEFDSPPHPLVFWLKVPGTWSHLRQRLVTVAEENDRWSFSDLRAAVPVHTTHTHARHSSWSYRADDRSPIERRAPRTEPLGERLGRERPRWTTD